MTDMFVAGVELMADTFVAGGGNSWTRVAGSPEEQKEKKLLPRERGDGLLAHVRLDAGYYRVGQQIHGVDLRGELGYGWFGGDWRATNYTDRGTGTTLELQQLHLLYRMALGSTVEVDMGIGSSQLTGVRTTSGGSFTLPILIHPSPAYGIELRPSWMEINGNSIANHEIALEVGGSYWALRAGYRWLRSPNVELDGPFVGVSARF